MFRGFSRADTIVIGRLGVREMKPKHNRIDSLGPTNATASRRREMRFEPPAGLRCGLTGSRDRVLVRDIGIGGIAIFSNLPFAPDRLQEFTLNLGPLTVVQRAQLVHGRRDDDGRWIYGFEFVKEQAHGASIEELIDLITGSSIEFG